jgi:tRNA (guanine37-N1)-methyltransferase
MRIDILTLFPETVGDYLCESILGRAQERGLIRINTWQIRDYTTNKQNQVDDYPYGGGHGAVMQADPLFRCWAAVCQDVTEFERVRTIYLSPCGVRFDQTQARRLKDSFDRLILVCGHYEGIDQRFIDECVDEEISLGDFVLTGGEIPAMAVADAVCRMVPGVLSDPECFEEESHWNGTLEYPQYSRPEIWHGRRVPPVLLSGHHANVAKWRWKQSVLRTKRCRPDMYQALRFETKQEKKLMKELRAEYPEDFGK